MSQPMLVASSWPALAQPKMPQHENLAICAALERDAACGGTNQPAPDIVVLKALDYLRGP
jgi:hypothetical protein